MYEKNTWANGDVITAEKLNHMEDVIASGGGESPIMNITMTNDEPPKLDATWQQIHDAFETGLVLVRSEVPGFGNQVMFVQDVWEEDSNSFCLNVLMWAAGNGVTAIPFLARTSDGYPEWDL